MHCGLAPKLGAVQQPEANHPFRLGPLVSGGRSASPVHRGSRLDNCSGFPCPASGLSLMKGPGRSTVHSPPPPSLLPSPGWPYGQRYQTGGKTLLWYHALERVGTINPPEPGCLDHFIYQGPFPLSLWFSSTITHISPYSAFSSASQTLTALSILLPLR